MRQAGAVEVGDGTPPRAATRCATFEAYDTHSASPQPAELQVGRLRLRYLLETDERAGYLCIGLARVTEVAADRRVILDERWIPPALVCSAARAAGRPDRRVVRHAEPARRGAGGAADRAGRARRVAQVADFLLLQSINRWQNLLAHWADAGNVHPGGAVHRRSCRWPASSRRSLRRRGGRTPIPAYRHEDLQRSFAPVVADLRRSLSAVLEATAMPIPLQERAVRRARRADHRPLDPARGELRADGAGRRADRAAAAAVPVAGEDRRGRAYPRTGERGDARASRCGRCRWRRGRCRSMPARRYFELDRNSPHWQQMQTSGGFAIHVSGEFPNLRLELWAIRG